MHIGLDIIDLMVEPIDRINAHEEKYFPVTVKLLSLEVCRF